VFLYFGLIRAYKGVDDLVRLFQREFVNQDSVLIIAGDPHTKAVEQRLRALVGSNSKIVLDLRVIPPDRVGELFEACDVVVLPYVKISTPVPRCSPHLWVASSSHRIWVRSLMPTSAGLPTSPRIQMALLERCGRASNSTLK